MVDLSTWSISANKQVSYSTLVSFSYHLLSEWLLPGGKICILKTNLFQEALLVPFHICWYRGCMSYLLLHDSMTPDLIKTTHVLSLVFHGSGVWVQLSCVLCFRISKGCIQVVSWGCTLSEAPLCLSAHVVWAALTY